MAWQQQSQSQGSQSQSQSQGSGRRGCLTYGTIGALLLALATGIATGLGTGVGREIADRIMGWGECLLGDCPAEDDGQLDQRNR